jgi:hypothetical protein
MNTCIFPVGEEHCDTVQWGHLISAYNTAQYLNDLFYLVITAHLYQGCQSFWTPLCIKAYCPRPWSFSATIPEPNEPATIVENTITLESI